MNNRYIQLVLALLAGFVLFSAGVYFARTSSPEPYRVITAQRPVQEAPEDASGPEDASQAQAEEARPDSLLPGEVIDLNTADIYDLQRLPGIGEKRAGDIIAWREEHGPFQAVDELEHISGIGPATVEGLREYAGVG